MNGESQFAATGDLDQLLSHLKDAFPEETAAEQLRRAWSVP
jgi:hypothetical protein